MLHFRYFAKFHVFVAHLCANCKSDNAMRIQMTVILAVACTSALLSVAFGQGYYSSSSAPTCSTQCHVAPRLTNRLNASECIIVFVDYQTGTVNYIRNTPLVTVLGNMRYLALTAKAVGIPAIMTTTLEEFLQGPVINDLIELYPDAFAARIKRTGTINPWDDPRFQAAISQFAAQGRKSVILAAITNDVCGVLPAMSLALAGYNTVIVQDASGSPNQMAEDNARRQWERAGARTVTTAGLMTELAYDFSTPDGQKIAEIVKGEYKDTFNQTYPATYCGAK